MTSFTDHLTDSELEQLTKLLGATIAWIHGSRFIVADDLVISPYLSFDQGGEFLLVRSERHESPTESLDYYGFSISSSTRADGDILKDPVLLETVSSFVVPSTSPVSEISVLSTMFVGDMETVDYDSWIVLRLEDDRELSIGHAPAVYTGVCVRLGGPPVPELEDSIERRVVLRP